MYGMFMFISSGRVGFATKDVAVDWALRTKLSVCLTEDWFGYSVLQLVMLILIMAWCAVPSQLFGTKRSLLSAKWRFVNNVNILSFFLRRTDAMMQQESLFNFLHDSLLLFSSAVYTFVEFLASLVSHLGYCGNFHEDHWLGGEWGGGDFRESCTHSRLCCDCFGGWSLNLHRCKRHTGVDCCDLARSVLRMMLLLKRTMMRRVVKELMIRWWNHLEDVGFMRSCLHAWVKCCVFIIRTYRRCAFWNISLLIFNMLSFRESFKLKKRSCLHSHRFVCCKWDGVSYYCVKVPGEFGYCCSTYSTLWFLALVSIGACRSHRFSADRKSEFSPVFMWRGKNVSSGRSPVLLSRSWTSALLVICVVFSSVRSV